MHQFRMTKKILLVILTSVFTAACNKQTDKSIELTNTLDNTFNSSRKELTEFLDNWAIETRNLKRETVDSVTLEIEKIYTTIFDPFDFEKLGWTGWKDKTMYTGNKYIIIQPEIPYSISNKIDTSNVSLNFIDTLRNFRPKIKFDNVETLYLTNEYQRTFENFLGNPKTESEKKIFYRKIEFIENVLRLPVGYDWKIILTQPYIDGIYLSTDMNEAIVEFTISQTGQQSYLKKENNSWRIIATKTIWIE
jgi:hypothetical protein